MKFVILCEVIILGLINEVQLWPNGAPDKSCDSLLPGHGNNKPKSGANSPFTVTQSHQEYEPGEYVKVSVRAPRGLSFKGLMVQAFDPITSELIGSFQGGRGLKAMDTCSAVTHSDRRGKRSATLLWVAPNSSPGSVAFRATIVQRFSEFYDPVNSVVDSSVQ